MKSTLGVNRSQVNTIRQSAEDLLGNCASEFDRLPLALRPTRSKERITPEYQAIPHKISKEDDLPETDSGLWLNNFTEISQRIGFRSLHSDFCLFSVPPPAEWLSDWHVGEDDGFTKHTYDDVDFPKRGCSIRMDRLRIAAWLLSLDIPKWVPYEKRDETLAKYKKAWKSRASS